MTFSEARAIGLWYRNNGEPPFMVHSDGRYSFLLTPPSRFKNRTKEFSGDWTRGYLWYFHDRFLIMAHTYLVLKNVSKELKWNNNVTYCMPIALSAVTSSSIGILPIYTKVARVYNLLADQLEDSYLEYIPTLLNLLTTSLFALYNLFCEVAEDSWLYILLHKEVGGGGGLIWIVISRRLFGDLKIVCLPKLRLSYQHQDARTKVRAVQLVPIQSFFRG